MKSEETREMVKIPLKKISHTEMAENLEKLEKRFNNSIEREEEHYGEYKFFENKTIKFQDEFPYHRLNWLGRLILWVITKRK